MKLSNKFKTIILTSLIAVFSIISFVPVFAEDTNGGSNCDSSIPESVRKANGCINTGTENDISTVIQSILNAIILVSGTIAVIFVLIGGIQYITSTGDSAKVEKAKKTILYACIGLIICALSFAIVNFVIINIIAGNH